jgi:hypothetical protein
MIASDVTTRVRDILLDQSKIRWTDAELFRHLTDAKRDLVKNRPDAQYVSSIVTTAPIAVTSLSDDMAIDDIFTVALTDYVCYRAFLKDSEDPAYSKRALDHLKLYLAGIS